MKRSMIRRAFAIDRAGGMSAAEANAEAAELAKAFEVSDGKPIEIAVTDAEFSSFTGGSEEDRRRTAEELKGLLCLN
jgi:hypothetical protein